MATLLLIRHAEPSETGTFLGQADPPLSPAGHVQARQALSHLQMNVVYVSPLRRARETAAYLPSRQIVLAELREIDFGAWTGKTWQQIQADWPALAQEKATKWLEVTPPGGESWIDFVSRIQIAWQYIRSGPSPIAVIAHAGVNAALASLIAGYSPLSFQQAHTEVISIEYEVYPRNDSEHST